MIVTPLVEKEPMPCCGCRHAALRLALETVCPHCGWREFDARAWRMARRRPGFPFSMPPPRPQPDHEAP